MAKKKVKLLASKNPLTVAELASLGGKARAAALSPERRKEIATKAVKARWAKRGLHLPSKEQDKR